MRRCIKIGSEQRVAYIKRAKERQVVCPAAGAYELVIAGVLAAIASCTQSASASVDALAAMSLV